MLLTDLEARIRRGLEQTLPGPDAQNLLAPRPRRGWQPGVVPPDCRRSAVLLLLFPGTRGEPVLLLTKRHASLLNHAGQVALPGGAVEEGERVWGATAMVLAEFLSLIGSAPDPWRSAAG